MKYHAQSLRHVMTVASLTALLAAGCSRGTVQVDAGDIQPMMKSATAMAAGWSDKHAETAGMLVQKYGEPDVVSDEALIWNNKGPFVRTVLWRNAVPHNFPMPHQDYLTQTIRHTVPADKLDDLWAYDGSVWAHRTRGEISAQCDMEHFNLLALNLAHDIITGKRTVADARAMYASTAMAYKNGDRSSPYTSRLMFPTEPNAADPDKQFMRH